MTSSTKPSYRAFNSATVWNFHGLAVESYRFQQLTGSEKVAWRCWKSRYAQKRAFCLQNFISDWNQLTSDLSPCMLTTTWARTCRSGWDFCFSFCFNPLIRLLRCRASNFSLLQLLMSLSFFLFSLTLCLANLSNAAFVWAKLLDNLLYLSLITRSRTSCWAITSLRYLIFWALVGLGFFDDSPC